MTRSLCLKATRALVAGSVIFSLGLSPVYAQGLAPPGGPVGHFAMTPFHGPLGVKAASGWRGWGGRGWENRGGFAPNVRRDGHNGWAYGDVRRGRGNSRWNGRGAYTWTGRGGVGQGGWDGYPGLWASGSWVVSPEPQGVPAAPEIIVVGEAPHPAVAGSGGGSGGQRGGCVIHHLEYDGAGNYVGESETPSC